MMYFILFKLYKQRKCINLQELHTNWNLNCKFNFIDLRVNTVTYPKCVGLTPLGQYYLYLV